MPLSRSAGRLRLADLPRIEGNPQVIVGNVAGAGLMNLEKPWRAIRKDAGLDDVRLHDLRHAFAAVAASSGMGLPIIGKILGHTQAATTHRYAHLAADPVKAAAAAVAGKDRPRGDSATRRTKIRREQADPRSGPWRRAGFRWGH